MSPKENPLGRPGNYDNSRAVEKHAIHIQKILTWISSTSSDREKWGRKKKFFRQSTEDYLSFLIPTHSRILCLGSGDGATLASVNPSYGVGVDLDHASVILARERYPHLEFVVGDVEDPEVLRSLHKHGPFDVILLADTLGYLDDVHNFLVSLRHLCTAESRLISVYYGYLWEPLLRLSEKCGLREPSFDTTWLRMVDVEKFFYLAGFDSIKKEWRLLCPFALFGIGRLINRFIAPLPLVRKLCVRHYLVARLASQIVETDLTVTVVIPCRNEKGNIEPAVTRLPELGSQMEVIFVEGHSSDGTWEEIERVKQAYPNLDIRSLRQVGEGKGDAVRAAFERAKGDVLMILDADLTVPPEDLPKFFEAIATGRGEFINGSRLIYGMEDQAMRFLNYVANHIFASAFTYLINQKLTDTLCGTKVLKRIDYERISANREYFGDFDPFGDFDLIFGANKLNLKVIEVPIRYANREYGTTQISRFRHGLLLLKMVVFAYIKHKAI